MIVSRIVTCLCGETVSLPGIYTTKFCPSCDRVMHAKYNENPYIAGDEENIPIVSVYAYHPADIQYFYSNNFPENGKKILCIYNSSKAKFFVWEEVHKIAYERDNETRGVDNMFSWKYVDN